ncbi:MAG: hypothetical protein KJZ83_09695 [Burkholderiaceae bacterium]|nr:hypothetical protein [Burkholderiaceae bacterium]
MDRLAELNEQAALHGLRVRGVFAPREDDAIGPLDGGRPARSVALLGNEGSSFWGAFAASPEHGDGERDALDRWSRRVGTQMAQRLGARALFPFGGPPHHPFQRWAMRARDLFASPVGLLVHPEYGLWHAFRFALAYADQLRETPAPAKPRSPCADCAARPCLSACPVEAFVEGEYRVPRCVEHLLANPQGPCVTTGCIARHACPVGQAHRYLPAQAQLHMRAFVAKLAGLR